MADKEEEMFNVAYCCSKLKQEEMDRRRRKEEEEKNVMKKAEQRAKVRQRLKQQKSALWPLRKKKFLCISLKSLTTLKLIFLLCLKNRQKALKHLKEIHPRTPLKY